MNRREWLLSTASASAALMVPSEGIADILPQSSEGKWDTSVVRLKLRHTWTTTMSSSDYRDTLHVRYTRDGVTGYGEGAP